MKDDERRELIAALHELTKFAERLLELNGQMLQGMTGRAAAHTEGAGGDPAPA